MKTFGKRRVLPCICEIQMLWASSVSNKTITYAIALMTPSELNSQIVDGTKNGSKEKNNQEQVTRLRSRGIATDYNAAAAN